jgi:alanine racemase
MRNANRIEIDLTAVAHNMAVLRRIVGPSCAICPVVKADAYGLGIVRVAKCLVQAGADMLAVYTVQQAAELFGGAVSGPVLALMPVRSVEAADEAYRALVCGRLHLAVHDGGQLEDLMTLANRYGLILPVHLEVDTGMCRGGCDPLEAPDLLRRIAAHPRLELAGIYTHFASAETDLELTLRQQARLEALLVEHAKLIPNTAAALRDRRFHGMMIRVGQAWAGYGPECITGPCLPEAERLQPAVTLRSTIVQIKTIAAGARVGYGATWAAPRASVIGLVPLGYADGYPLALSSREDGTPRACVAVLGPDRRAERGPRRAHAPIVGRVNMDQISIDLTDVVGDGDGIDVGATVELITPDRGAPNHLVTLARAAGTSPYELLCRLNPRMRRVYRQEPAVVEVFPREAATAAAG